MIRLLHTSDWHLGKRLERFSRHEEQVQVLDEICQIAEVQNVDAILIAGDLFDAFNPPAESLDLFYKTLKRLANNGKRPVIAIAGNHDMPERIEAPDPLARECGIIFAGFPESVVTPYTLEGGFSIARSCPGFFEVQMPGKEPLRIIATPYANEMRLRKALLSDDNEAELRQLLTAHWNNIAEKYCDNNGVNILVSHLLFMAEGGDAPVEPEDERSINYIGGAQTLYTTALPSNLQYVALGHLHRKQTVDKQPCPVVYSGSPLSYSFSEAAQKKYVVITDIEPGKEAILTFVELNSGKRLERKKFYNIVDAESWLLENQNTLVELTLVSETYLSGTDRRKLNELHPGIVTIIPEIVFSSAHRPEEEAGILTEKSINELFVEFFRKQKGQEADDAIIALFNEINAQEEEL